jgi:ATP-dependent DNA helicase PIF1
MILSREQQFSLDKFRQGENIFITGPGGTGKTQLIREFLAESLRKKRKIQICSLTGCSAVLLNCGAKTIHSWSGIKLAKGEKEKIIQGVLTNRKALRQWKTTQILIIDEVSMMSRKIFEILNEIGKRVRYSSAPFGGIQVVFTGDFFQLPPVGSSSEPETEQFCFESEQWLEVFSWENHVELETIFRQSDREFIDVLMKARRGEMDEPSIQVLRNRLQVKYDPAKNNGCVPTKLFPIRSKVDRVNQTMFEKIDDDEYHLEVLKKTNCRIDMESGKALGADVLYVCDRLTDKEREYELEYLLNNCPCARTLLLKRGSAVLCTVNLDMEQGICNGSQGIIMDILEKDGTVLPIVKFSNGVVKTISPHFWQSEEFPCVMIGQYPLILAWAMTIHKMQGVTLDMGEMDIGNSIFEYGQSYVALSRIRSLNGVYLSAFEPDKIRANPKVLLFYDKMPKRDWKRLNEKPATDFSEFAYTDPTVASTTKIIRL